MLARNPIYGQDDARMWDKVKCYMRGKRLVFPTRREAMDAMLQGALTSTGDDEYMFANMMLQLMHGFKRCYDVKKLI